MLSLVKKNFPGTEESGGISPVSSRIWHFHWHFLSYLGHEIFQEAIEQTLKIENETPDFGARIWLSCWSYNKVYCLRDAIKGKIEFSLQSLYDHVY